VADQLWLMTRIREKEENGIVGFAEFSNSNSNNSDLKCAPYKQTDGAFQSSHSVFGVSSMKKENSSAFFLNEAVGRKSFKSVGSRYQAQGAATEKAFKVCRQSFRVVLGTT